jgi:hypothetical protein
MSSNNKHQHPIRRRAATACLAAVVLLGAAFPSLAGQDGGAPGAFLRFGSSARSLALGGAVTALGGDASTSYWNPACLSQLRTMELSAMAATLFADTKYNYVSFGLPSEGKGVFAVSGSFINSGGFERSSIFEDMNDAFEEKEGVFALSYARGGSRLGWGVTFKSISQDVAGYTGSGYGMDLGLYLRPERRLSLGLAWQNALQPEITLDQEPEKLARTLRAGAVLHFFNDRFLVLSDLVRTDLMDTGFQGGLEARPLANLVLRGGYDSSRDQTSFGAGVRWQNWQIDYAHVSHDLGSTTVVSAGMSFGIADGVQIRGDRLRFSPSGNDRSVTFDIETALRGEIESWIVEIFDGNGLLVRRIEDEGPPPPTVRWGGEDEKGRLVSDGDYSATIVITDELGQTWEHTVPVEILGFRNRTRTPIRIDISGSEGDNSREDDR